MTEIERNAEMVRTLTEAELAAEIVRRWIDAGQGASLVVLARMAIQAVREQFDGGVRGG